MRRYQPQPVITHLQPRRSMGMHILACPTTGQTEVSKKTIKKYIYFSNRRGAEKCFSLCLFHVCIMKKNDEQMKLFKRPHDLISG